MEWDEWNRNLLFISHNFIFNTAKLILGKVNLVSRNQQCSSGDEFATRSRKNNNNNNKIVHFKYNLRHLPWKIIVFLLGKHDGWMEIIRINFLLKFLLPKRSSQNVCKSLFLEKRKHLLLCYVIWGLWGNPRIKRYQPDHLQCLPLNWNLFFTIFNRTEFFNGFFLFSVTRPLLNLVLIASYRRRV